MLGEVETWHFFKEQQSKSMAQFDSAHCDIAL